MASFKLDEGIRAFMKDTMKLKEILRGLEAARGKAWAN